MTKLREGAAEVVQRDSEQGGQHDDHEHDHVHLNVAPSREPFGGHIQKQKGDEVLAGVDGDEALGRVQRERVGDVRDGYVGGEYCAEGYCCADYRLAMQSTRKDTGILGGRRR